MGGEKQPCVDRLKENSGNPPSPSFIPAERFPRGKEKGKPLKKLKDPPRKDVSIIRHNLRLNGLLGSPGLSFFYRGLDFGAKILWVSVERRHYVAN